MLFEKVIGFVGRVIVTIAPTTYKTMHGYGNTTLNFELLLWNIFNDVFYFYNYLCVLKERQIR